MVSSSYKAVYGFVPSRYKKHNFLQTVRRSLKTGDIERVIKGDKVYLKLTSSGKEKNQRYFSVNSLTKKWNRKWVIVFFDIKEKSRSIRNRLCDKLRNLGFGMLRQSIWIMPLPIAKDIPEVIEAHQLSKSTFVLEVSHLFFGDQKELARRVWHLDVIESEYLKLRDELKRINQLNESFDGRLSKREANINKKTRILKRKYVYRIY